MTPPHLKNWIAFKVLIDACIYDMNDKMPSAEYLKEKFERYVLSEKPDAYKWGIHPLVVRQLYHYFDKYHIPLDADEQKAKDAMTEDDHYDCVPYDRRWPKGEDIE